MKRPKPGGNVALALDLLQRGRVPDAIVFLEEAIAPRPGDAVALRLLGCALADSDNLARAESLLERAVAAAPCDAIEHNFLGVVRQKRGACDAAKKAYERALALAPRDDAVRNNFGYLLLERGAAAAAREHLQAAVRFNPQNAMTWNNLGNAHCDLGDAASAGADYRRATTLDVNCVPAWVNLATVEQELGAPARAVDCLARALRVDVAIRACGRCSSMRSPTSLRPSTQRSIRRWNRWSWRRSSTQRSKGRARLRMRSHGCGPIRPSRRSKQTRRSSPPPCARPHRARSIARYFAASSPRPSCRTFGSNRGRARYGWRSRISRLSGARSRIAPVTRVGERSRWRWQSEWRTANISTATIPSAGRGYLAHRSDGQSRQASRRCAPMPLSVGSSWIHRWNTPSVR